MHRRISKSYVSFFTLPKILYLDQTDLQYTCKNTFLFSLLVLENLFQSYYHTVVYPYMGGIGRKATTHTNTIHNTQYSINNIHLSIIKITRRMTAKSKPDECASPGCTKRLETKLACPKCAQLNLTPAHFCCQECFKSNYSSHKTIHEAAIKMYVANSCSYQR